jgi:hypothetical protein
VTAPASVEPATERERLFVADAQDEAETRERVASLVAKAAASEPAATAALAHVDALVEAARDDAAAVKREHRQRERRRLAVEWDLRRLAPPVLFAFADALDAHTTSLRMGRVEAPSGTPRGPAAVQAAQLARELREDVAILPAGEMAEALARIRAEVSLMLLGVPAWQTRFLVPFLADATEGEDI